jgi:hypothetical protein
MLGVTLGLVLRRLLPAMALTWVCYIIVQVVMGLWVRPALLTPEHRQPSARTGSARGCPDRPTAAARQGSCVKPAISC